MYDVKYCNFDNNTFSLINIFESIANLFVTPHFLYSRMIVI